MEQLGIQPVQLFMQAINIIVLVGVLSKLLFKPVLQMIHSRQKLIKEGVDLQGKMLEEKEKLLELRKKEVDKGRAEGQKIIDEAREQAKEQAKRIVREAENAAKEEQSKGVKEIEMLKSKLESQIRKDTIELATSMAEKVLADILKDEKMQRKLLEKRMLALQSLAHENK